MGASAAPIDAFGLGASLVTSSDAPTLDCAYKLQEYAGTPRRKLSAGKEPLTVADALQRLARATG
jgi:nicotinate phosphoribosyltransferase